MAGPWQVSKGTTIICLSLCLSPVCLCDSINLVSETLFTVGEIIFFNLYL